MVDFALGIIAEILLHNAMAQKIAADSPAAGNAKKIHFK